MSLGWASAELIEIYAYTKWRDIDKTGMQRPFFGTCRISRHQHVSELDFIRVRMMAVRGAVCKAPVKSISPTNQRPALNRPDALPVARPTAPKEWNRTKLSHSSDLLSPNSPGFFHPCLWPLKTPAYLEEGCQASRQPADGSKVKCAILLLGIGGVLISLPKAMSP